MKINKLLESKKLRESDDKEVIFQKGNKKIIKDGYGYGIEDDTNVTTNRFYVNGKGEPKFEDGTPSKFWLDKVTSLVKSGKITSRKDEGYSHFEFTSGSNPYIAKTKDEVERIKRSRGDSVRYVGSINGIDYYKVDDSEKDLFSVDDLDEGSIPRNASRIKALHKYGDRKNPIELHKDGKYWRHGDEMGTLYDPSFLRNSFDIEVLETDPNYKPNRTKPEYVVQGNYGYGWEDLTASDNQAEARNDLKAYRENETGVSHRLITRRVPVTENLKESFKENSELDEPKATNVDLFRPGDTVYVKPSKKLGRVKSVKGDYIKVEVMGGKDPDRIDTYYPSDLELQNSPNNESKSINETKESEEAELITQYINNGEFDKLEKVQDGTNVIWKLKESIEEGYELNPNIDITWRPYDNEKGQVMADKWYASKWPDDEVGIEQLKGITLDDALKDRSILGHCDTQVRERVYAQLDKYIPLSVDSPMYKEVNESFTPLYIIKDSKGNQLSAPNPDDSELWDRVESMEARGRRGLSVVVYVDKDNTTKVVNETSYGGAFDIANDQYFTREDIENAAEEVLSHIQETFKEPYHLGGTWFEDGKWIVNVQDENFNEYEVSVSVDMRRIKEPWHLRRAYASTVAANIIQQIKDQNADVLAEENITGKYDFDDDVDDLSYYYEDDIWEEPGVDPRKDFIEDGKEFTWVKRCSDTEHLDFDSWAVWEAYCHDDAESYYFVVEEDTEFIDWGPCDTLDEAREFLQSKVDDYNAPDEENMWSEDDFDDINEETEKSPVVHKKSDGSYLVSSENGDGYTAYNKSDVWVGHISANDETEAKNKFNANKFDESLEDENMEMRSYKVTYYLPYYDDGFGDDLMNYVLSIEAPNDKVANEIAVRHLKKMKRSANGDAWHTAEIVSVK